MGRGRPRHRRPGGRAFRRCPRLDRKRRQSAHRCPGGHSRSLAGSGLRDHRRRRASGQGTDPNRLRGGSQSRDPSSPSTQKQLRRAGNGVQRRQAHASPSGRSPGIGTGSVRSRTGGLSEPRARTRPRLVGDPRGDEAGVRRQSQSVLPRGKRNAEGRFRERGAAAHPRRIRPKETVTAEDYTSPRSPSPSNTRFELRPSMMRSRWLASMICSIASAGSSRST